MFDNRVPSANRSFSVRQGALTHHIVCREVLGRYTVLVACSTFGEIQLGEHRRVEYFTRCHALSVLCLVITMHIPVAISTWCIQDY